MIVQSWGFYEGGRGYQVNQLAVRTIMPALFDDQQKVLPMKKFTSNNFAYLSAVNTNYPPDKWCNDSYSL